MKKISLTLLALLATLSLFAQLDSFFESFDETENMPAGWSSLVNSSNSAADVWVHTSEFDAYSGTNFVKMTGTIETDTEVLALFTPELTNPSDNTLNFYSKSSWGDPADLVRVGTISDPNNMNTFTEVSSFTLTGEYQLFTVNFPTTTDTQIAFFHGPTDDLQYAVYLDDISWEPSDVIPNPAVAVYPANTAVNVTLASATMTLNQPLEWSPTGGFPTGYTLSVGASNPPTDIIDSMELGDVTTYTLSTPLEFSTTYFWQVIPNNETGEAIDCPVFAFTTLDDQVVDFNDVDSYFEGFEAGEVGFLPLGMEQQNIGDDNAQWSIIADSQWSENAHSGTQCVHMAFSFSLPNDDWLYTKPLNMIAGNVYHLSFYYKCAQFEASWEKMDIHIGDSANSTTMGEALWSNDNITNLEYEFVEIDYTATEDGIKFFSFHNYSDALQYVLFVDDLSIQEEDFSSADDEVEIAVNNLSNYPNPFNPTTTISFNLTADTDINLEIFNSKGQQVTTLINEYKTAGTHSVVWNGKNSKGQSVTSGIYFYKLDGGTFTSTKKMILLK